MGSSKSKECNKIIFAIWEWAISKNIWLSASHIPGILNVEADKQSRKCENSLEWKLSEHNFKTICKNIEKKPSIDLFASRINCQITKFVSYRPDPQAFAVNAFTLQWSDLFFYAFPPFSIITQEQPVSAEPTRTVTPIAQQVETAGLSSVRKKLEGQKQLPKAAVDIIMHANSKGTNKQYEPIIRDWIEFCGKANNNPYTASIEDGITFLTDLFHTRNVGYSMINTARSALSQIINPKDGLTFGKQPLVQRFMKGVFRLRPALPKYSYTYDAKIVITYLKNMDKDECISLKDLTMKLAILISLLTAQRAQTIISLNIEDMEMNQENCKFLVRNPIKTTAPGRHITPIVLKKYQLNKQICPVNLIKLYLERTANLRVTHKQLFISFTPPYSPVTTTTLSRWCKKILEQAGIPTKFSSHSTRSASVSKAFASGLSVVDICKAADWTNERTFAKFYNREIITNLGESILDNC
eukprot:gene4188-4745_t